MNVANVFYIEVLYSFSKVKYSVSTFSLPNDLG